MELSSSAEAFGQIGFGDRLDRAIGGRTALETFENFKKQTFAAQNSLTENF